MAYYEMMPAGLPAGLQSGMDSVLNKKFGTATSYAPGTWPDTVNLMGPLPEKTIVSWPIADFNDGADDVPTKSLVVTIPATLSGFSTITETQTGRNFYPIQIGTDRFINNGGATHSDDNGTLVIVTSTGSASGVYINTADDLCEVRNVLKWCNDRGISKTISFDVVASVDNVSLRVTSGSNTLFTVGTTPTRVSHVSTSNNFSLYTVNTPSTLRISNFQIELGSTAHAYEPYTAPTTYTAQLGRTVYGGEVDIVNGVGHSTRIKKTVRWGDLGNVTQLADVTRKEIVLSASETPKYITASASTDLLNDKNLPYDMTYSGNFEHIYIANTARIWVYLPNGTDADTEITVSYTLADALQTDFAFDGQGINTRLGYNAFWSEEGDTEVTYRADISLALQALSGSRGLMMARPQLEPETEPEETTEETPEEMER